MTTAISLAVLDMAGTTVADDGAVERAFVTALDAVGCAGADLAPVVRRAMGRSKIEVFTELTGDERRARRANAVFESSYDEAVRHGEVSPLPGAENTLRALRRAGLAVCLTTGFSPATRDHLLASIGWRGLADLALSPSDAGRGRPYPDMVLTAVLRLAVDDVRQVAVVGDTVSDLQAGWRAGASVVAGVLTGAHTREELSGAPHTHLLDHVGQLPGVVL